MFNWFKNKKIPKPFYGQMPETRDIGKTLIGHVADYGSLVQQDGYVFGIAESSHLVVGIITDVIPNLAVRLVYGSDNGRGEWFPFSQSTGCIFSVHCIFTDTVTPNTVVPVDG